MTTHLSAAEKVELRQNYQIMFQGNTLIEDLGDECAAHAVLGCAK